jgi:hypothetical protein
LVSLERRVALTTPALAFRDGPRVKFLRSLTDR